MKYWGKPIAVALGFIAPLFAQTIDPMRVRFSSVQVTPESIRLDSARGTQRFFSGELTYDLITDYDSVPVHVFLEEVPIAKTFMIYHEEVGRSRFVRIDSLSRGDIGWVKPKSDCRVRWSYSTSNPRNHCRVKVGLGNLEYLVTRDSIQSHSGVAPLSAYTYNSLGLPVRRALLSTTPPETMAYSYNGHGKPLFAPPFTWYRYDAQGRLHHYQIGEEHTLQGVFGYVYDSSSKVTEIQHLEPGISKDVPGPAFNRELFGVDDKNRIVFREIKISAHAFSCNPQFVFNGVEKHWTWYYQDTEGNAVDSTVSESHDSTRSPPLLWRTVGVTRKRGATLLNGIETSEGFDMASGSCYAPAMGRQTVYEYQADARNHVEKTLIRVKPIGTDSFGPVLTRCNRREYDAAGRVLRRFSSCEDTVGHAWVYDPFGFVKAQATGSTWTLFERSLYDLDTLEAFKPE